MLVRAIRRLQRRPLVVALVGIALEVGVIAAIGSDDQIAGIRGIGGESAVSLAVVGAVFAGPWVGAALALAGWSVFFPLIAHASPPSVVALPVWVGTAVLVGRLSRGLTEAVRLRTEAERDAQAAHALRTPVATIHGLVRVLRSRDGRDEAEAKVIAAIEDETSRLLESPVLSRPAGRRP
jgi:signal transduction histidine kinase